MFDDQERLVSLNEQSYTRRDLVPSRTLPVFLPSTDMGWTCRPRTGSPADQETACRGDVGVQTDRTWSELAPMEQTWFAAAPGPGGPAPSMWHETATTQRGVGAAAGGPVRASSAARLLISDDDHYLVLETESGRTETVAGVTRQLARQISEYDMIPLALPSKVRTWVQGDEYAVSMRRHDSTTGVLLWAQRPEQYRRAPNATEVQRVKTSYAYDPWYLYATSATNELGHVVQTVKDLGTGVAISTAGPNSWPDTQCPTCPPVLERSRVDIDGFGRPLRTWGVDDQPGANHALAIESTATYHDDPGTWARVESARYQVRGQSATAIRSLTEIDGTGLVMSTTAYAATTGTHPLDALTSYVYDSAGALVSVTGPDPSNDNAVVTYRVDQDALGREIRTVRPDETSIVTSYDGVTVSRQEVARSGDSDPGPLATTIAVVDEFGDLRTVTEVDAVTTGPTSYLHDGLGRVRQVTDPDGNPTVLEHDGAGRRTAVIRGDRVWRYGYDHDGNQTTLIAPYMAGQDPVRYTTSVVYDALGRPLSRLQGVRELTAQELDRFGNGSASWTYDQGANGIGRLYSATTSSGRDAVITQSYAYDAHGNATDETLAFSVWGRFGDTRHTSRTFDALGVTSVTHADGVGASAATRVVYDRDARGLPRTASWLTSPGGSAPQVVASLVWNRAGRLVRRDHDLYDQRWARDPNGRLTSVEVRSRPHPTALWWPVASQTLSYFAADDVRAMTTSVDVVTDEASYREDWIFDYDQRHQLTGVSGPSYEGLFTYTAGGRLKSVFVDGPPALDRDLRYAYAAPGAGNEAPVRLLGSNTVFIAHDLAGNQTRNLRLGGGYNWTFRYDGGDELRDASGSGGATGHEVYWYDASGTRLLALTLDPAGEPSALRLTFGETEVHYDATGVTRTEAYLNLGGAVGRIVDRTAIEYTFHNQLGHLLAAVDEHGVAVAGFTYSPFGELIRTLGSDAATFRRRFNGKEHDAATGLHYYGARYYDDFSFLWTQADPLYTSVPDGAGTQPRRANRYSFSGNNPLRYVDPDGKDWGDVGDFLRNRVADAVIVAGAVGGGFVAGLAAAPSGPGAVAAAIGGAGLGAGIGYSAAAYIRPGGPEKNFTAEGAITAIAEGATYEMGGQTFNALLKGAAKAVGAKLSTSARADQIHGVLDPVAQRRRTTAVLKTEERTVVAGGGRDLTPAQRAALLPGEEAAARANGVHAEVKALVHARVHGYTLQELEVTRRFCPSCARIVESFGGTLTSETRATFADP